MDSVAYTFLYLSSVQVIVYSQNSDCIELFSFQLYSLVLIIMELIGGGGG